MKPMFVDDAARARMAGWFETFRAAIAVRARGGLQAVRQPIDRKTGIVVL